MVKILTLSDLHYGKWGDFAANTIREAANIAKAQKPDVLLLGGDLAEPAEGNLHQVLQHIRALPIENKLWVVGNNDLEYLKGPISSYAKEAQALAQPFGIHVLDNAPAYLNGMTFVGNLGWFDGSLWGRLSEPLLDDKGWAPTTYAEATAKADAWTASELKDRMDISSQELFELCQVTLAAHLDKASGPTVLMTHTSPTPHMCLYGHSAEYDYLNYFMGWDDQGRLSQDPQVKLRLCGHTHRQKAMLSTGAGSPLFNISGTGQPFVFEVLEPSSHWDVRG